MKKHLIQSKNKTNYFVIVYCLCFATNYICPHTYSSKAITIIVVECMVTKHKKGDLQHNLLESKLPPLHLTKIHLMNLHVYVQIIMQNIYVLY